MSTPEGQALLTETIEAHGGIDRWSTAETITADVQVRGLMPTVLFPGRPLDDYHYKQTVQAQRLHNVLEGFPTPDLTCTFSPEEVRADRDGRTIARRVGARGAFAGWGSVRRFFHWDAIDTAYFVGYAMANYLTHPYMLGRYGIAVKRGRDVRVADEIWRRLEVTHPEGFDSHCRDETFFIDERGLIRRHDYTPDILPVARNVSRTPLLGRTLVGSHFSTRHRECDGLVFPTFRRVMLAWPARAAIPGLTVICAQLSNITVTYASAEQPGAIRPDGQLVGQGARD